MAVPRRERLGRAGEQTSRAHIARQYLQAARNDVPGADGGADAMPFGKGWVARREHVDPLERRLWLVGRAFHVIVAPCALRELFLGGNRLSGLPRLYTGERFGGRVECQARGTDRDGGRRALIAAARRRLPASRSSALPSPISRTREAAPGG